MREREQHGHVGERRHQTHIRLPTWCASGFCSRNAVGPHTSLGENLEDLSATTSSKMSCSTKRCGTLSWERTSKTSTETPTASCPPALTIQEPLRGSWAPPKTNVMLTTVTLCTGGVRRGVGQLSRRRPTRDGHILRATTPEGASPIIGPGTLPQQTPGFLQASPAMSSTTVRT